MLNEENAVNFHLFLYTGLYVPEEMSSRGCTILNLPCTTLSNCKYKEIL